jgi:hypothetical protein
VATRFAGTVLAVCAASAPQLALDSRHDRPGPTRWTADDPGRPPAFALHKWTGRQLITHFGTAAGDNVLARYDEEIPATVIHLLHERKYPGKF